MEDNSVKIHVHLFLFSFFALSPLTTIDQLLRSYITKLLHFLLISFFILYLFCFFLERRRGCQKEIWLVGKGSRKSRPFFFSITSLKSRSTTIPNPFIYSNLVMSSTKQSLLIIIIFLVSLISIFF